VAVRRPAAASNVVTGILEAVSCLEERPKSGWLSPELDSFPCREIVVNPCHVFYKLEGGDVVVLFVMRQEKDLRKYLLENEDDS